VITETWDCLRGAPGEGYRDRKGSEMAEADGGEELTITRVFNAPRDLVWRAWTEPEFVKRWWGPRGFTSPVARIDLRVGGKYVNCMRSPEGKDYWSTGVYQEIVEPERIVCTDSFADEEGNVVSASHYDMSPEFPLEMLLTVRFEEQDEAHANPHRLPIRGGHRGRAGRLERIARQARRGARGEDDARD